MKRKSIYIPDEEVCAKRMDVMRVAKLKVMKAAQKKRQKSIVDFFP